MQQTIDGVTLGDGLDVLQITVDDAHDTLQVATDGLGGFELVTDCEYTLNSDMSISVNVYPVLIPALASV